MTTQHPPRLAMWLLTRFVYDDEPLTGDLLEEFQLRQSRWWFWRQTLAAITAASSRRSREIRPLRLVDGDPGPRFDSPRDLPRRTVNLTASPIPDVGGLGLLALAVLITLTAPGAWWLVLIAAVGGIVLGIGWIALDRRHLHR